ncbi:hypothetical protein SDC9_53759 [bioreactor metagenome]|uniref:Resolvase/invertase-type recombinase catalytic domain-containing protein n=1 Tax=bioreactor metagenome TaxID=1076179 RepID=A0A644WZI7_9ZZZZ
MMKKYKKRGKKMKVLIYSRVALNDNNKLDKNIEEMKEYIKSQPDWELKDVYSEVASGLDNSKTEYNKLIKDIEEKVIDIVIVKNESSLCRDVVEFLKLINLLEKNNVKLFILDNKDFYKK